MGSTIKPVPDIPAETLQAARRVYHLEHIYMLVGDQLCEILTAVDLQLLDPTFSLGSSMTTRLALVTAFQYAEHLPDPLAADATLKRMDWKYALHLPLQHPGIGAPVLCQFRQNLYASPAAMKEFRGLLKPLGALGLYGREVLKTLDPAEALLVICQVSRLYFMKEAMKAALSMLVSRDPDWLRVNALPHWYTRYQTGRLNKSIDPNPNNAEDEAKAIGADMGQLLSRLCQPGCRVLRAQPEIIHMARLWEEQFFQDDSGLQWRLPGCANCSSNYWGIAR